MPHAHDQKSLLLQQLYQEHASLCTPCHFGKLEPLHRVFGEGNSHASLMFIGEAPGAEEDRLKRPFVGRSGRLLDTLFHAAGFARKDVYITNVVKCRPPQNRTPLPTEISPELKQLLWSEIRIVAPRVICTLGAVATRLFFPHEESISRIRGKAMHHPKIPAVIVPTYHPAYALRNKDGESLLAVDILSAFKLSQKLQSELNNS